MKVFCLLSDERAFRSLSPAMHTHALRRAGIDGVYVPFKVPVNRLGDAIRGLRALSVAGANVTVPFKEAVLPHLDKLSQECSALGAVNTIVRTDNVLAGHNTDAGGFVDTLHHAGLSGAAMRVLLIGTGGAARAVAHGVKGLGPHSLSIVGRNKRKAERLAHEMTGTPLTFDELHHDCIAADLVVNATSVSSPDESPELAGLISRLTLRECRFMIDLNYGRTDNIWRALAERSNARFMDGLPMLAYQARRSFELWTGILLPVAEFLEALPRTP